jgi:hypothetical protein
LNYVTEIESNRKITNTFKEEVNQKMRRELFKTEVYLNPTKTHAIKTHIHKISFLPEIKIKEMKSEILPKINLAYSKDKIMKYMAAFMNNKPAFKFKK